MDATTLEGCGPSQPLKALWVLFCRHIPLRPADLRHTTRLRRSVALPAKVDVARHTLPRSRARRNQLNCLDPRGIPEFLSAQTYGNSHDCFRRRYSVFGSWTINGYLSASNQWMKRSKLAKLTAVHPAVPLRSRPQTWKKMQEPNPGTCDQLCSSITPSLYRPPTASIDSEVDQSRYLTSARETMRL